jgi:hypothetical protein
MPELHGEEADEKAGRKGLGHLMLRGTRIVYRRRLILTGAEPLDGDPTPRGGGA